MEQLILHLIGDYITQSSWMAENKTKNWFPAFCHATIYSLPFLLIGSPFAVFVILITHYIIDRYRLARYVCWAKNLISPALANDPWKECEETGYSKYTPPWLSTWLMIIADNTIHLIINYFALKYL